MLPNGDLVSGGEDRTVRVWHEGKCACTIRFPDTIWGVAVTKDGDIAAACADGKTRVFTQNEVLPGASAHVCTRVQRESVCERERLQWKLEQ